MLKKENEVLSFNSYKGTIVIKETFRNTVVSKKASIPIKEQLL